MGVVSSEAVVPQVVMEAVNKLTFQHIQLQIVLIVLEFNSQLSVVPAKAG